MKRLIWTGLLCIGVLVSGCSTSGRNRLDDGPGSSTRGTGFVQDEDDRADLGRMGPDPTTHPAFETVNLMELLDPDGKIAARTNQSNARGWKTMSLSARYDTLFAKFRELHRDEGQESLRHRRNLVQNRLMLASERRCGRYFTYLKTEGADKNFGFGVASTALSALGALVPGARAAQNLSGSSALVSGLRAEYNNEYYSNLAVSVITRAIDEKRKVLRAQLRDKQRATYDSYDVAAAVSDAIEYDSSCGIVNGLEQANEAVQRINEPGRDAINRALATDRLTRALASDDPKALEVAGQYFKDLEKISSLGSLGSAVSTARLGTLGRTSGVSGFDGGADLAPARQAAGALGSIRDVFSDLSRDMRQSAADILAPLGTTTVANLQGSISLVVTTLSNVVATQVGGSGTYSCVVEAQALASKLTTADTAYFQALARAQDTRSAEDVRRDTMQAADAFREKLSRHLMSVRDFAQDLKRSFATSLREDGASYLKIWGAAEKKLTLDKALADVTEARQCKAPAAT